MSSSSMAGTLAGNVTSSMESAVSDIWSSMASPFDSAMLPVAVGPVGSTRPAAVCAAPGTRVMDSELPRSTTSATVMNRAWALTISWMASALRSAGFAETSVKARVAVLSLPERVALQELQMRQFQFGGIFELRTTAVYRVGPLACLRTLMVGMAKS